MSSLNQIPLIRLIIPFIFGIIAYIYFPFDENIIKWALIGGCSLYFILLMIKPLNTNFHFRWLFGVLIFINLALAGYNLTSLQSSKNHSFNLSDNQQQVMVGEIITPPAVKEKTVKTTLEIKGIHANNKWQSSIGKIIVFINKDSLSTQLKTGDYISFSPNIQNVPEPKNPHEFNYKKYLSYHLISQQSYLQSNNWKLVDNFSTNSIHTIADQVRLNLINRLKLNGVLGNQLDVASALILGYKNNIDAQLKSAYSSAGAMHVLAVSGLHVGVIFMVFNYLLKFFEKNKYGRVLKAIIIILILWLYALITGLSPSVMRAATMFSFVVLAKSLNRHSNFFNTLAASALLLLIINPYLIMDVGFQLSYTAVIGIVIIQPWLSSFYVPSNWLVQQIWSLTTVSIAAQIATAPLGLYYFHQFPNYFMLSNLLVIPLAIFILYLGLGLLILSFIPIVSGWIGFALNQVILFLNYCVNFIDQLPLSVSENIRFTLPQTVMVYGIICCVILLIYYRRFHYFFMGAALCILLLSNINLSKYKLLEQKKLVIYNIPKYSAINFIDGDDNILVSDLKLYNNKSKLMFHVKNNWIDKGLSNEKVVDLNKLKKQYLVSNIYRISNPNLFTKLNYFQYYQTKIAIIDDRFYPPKTDKKLNVDFLIWTKNNTSSLKDILKCFNFKKLIIDSSNSYYTNKELTQQAQNEDIPFWSVIENGAFVADINL